MGASDTNSNIPLLRAVGVTALDALVPCNRPHIPILEKQFPASLQEIYDEYQRLNLIGLKNVDQKVLLPHNNNLFFKKGIGQ
jgi:hypothetical protein